jgi:hypothetical protein
MAISLPSGTRICGQWHGADLGPEGPPDTPGIEFASDDGIVAAGSPECTNQLTGRPGRSGIGPDVGIASSNERRREMSVCLKFSSPKGSLSWLSNARSGAVTAA